MVDVHVHVGEGGLLPAEAMRLARVAGYRAVVLLCRSDSATLSLLFPWLLQMCQHYSLYTGVDAFPGVELVHVPPQLMYEVVAEARALGANFVAVHGEAPCGHVEVGTNMSAIAAGADVLLHPGLITAEDAKLAAEHGVALEITSAPRYCLANAHVAAMAEAAGCGLVFGSNAKCAADFVSSDLYEATLDGALLSALARRSLLTSTDSLLQRMFRG